MHSGRQQQNRIQRICVVGRKRLLAAYFLCAVFEVCLIGGIGVFPAEAQLLRHRETTSTESDPEILQRHQQWNLIRWYEPTLLYEQLEKNQAIPETRAWSESVQTLVDQLAICFPAGEEKTVRVGRGKIVQNLAKRAKKEKDASGIDVEHWNFLQDEMASQRHNLLVQLEQKVQEAHQQLIQSSGDVAAAVELGRSAFLLQRRICAWRYCEGVIALPASTSGPETFSSESWRQCLTEVQAFLSRLTHSETWKSYIRLQALMQLEALSPENQRDLAFRTLSRLDSTRLNASQRAVLEQEPLVRLTAQLRTVAAQRLAEDYLLQDVELYEMSDDMSSGNALIRECHRFMLETGTAPVFLQRMENVYRNANVRLMVSEEFLNRILPQPGREERNIHEYLFNRPIYGKGITTTSTRVRMIPDAGQFRLGFWVEGNLESRTYSQDSMVTVYNNAMANYVAFKEIQLGASGVRAAPAVSQARNQVQLKNLETSLDPIPIVGLVVNSVARSQAESKQQEAQQITENKLRNEVRTTLDKELDERIVRWNGLLQDKVFTPLGRLELDFQQVEAKTTEKDATLRLRLASTSQPGGYTPRPLVPSNSLINFQIHESAMNNFLQQLQLDGQTLTIAELKQHLQLRFPNWKPTPPKEEETVPGDFQITFAPTNAITVQILDRQLVLRLSIERLHVERRTWKNFQIHVPFRLEANGLQTTLYRDDVIRLVGRIPVSTQVALRGIFSKMFPKEFQKELLPESVRNNERFSMLAFNQCVLQDGWLGISLGMQENTAAATVTAEPVSATLRTRLFR